MKKSFKFISLILALVFLLSGTMMIVCYAENEAGSPDAGQGAGAGDAGGESGGNTGSGEVGGESGGNTGGESGGNTGGESGGNTGSGEVGGGDNSGYDSGYSDDYSGYSNNNNNNNNSNDNGYVEQSNDSDQLFYGDASNYDYNVAAENNESAAGSVSSNTKLYNSSGMSAADAAPNEWSDITLDEKTVQTGVTNFSSIKSNTEKEDNGYWILYLGYALLALATLGILYFIIATIAHRSAVKKAERLEQRRRNSPSASHSAAARMEERERREARGSGSYSKRTSRFADDDDYSYSRRGSSRSDTDEVYVPRRVASKKR